MPIVNLAREYPALRGGPVIRAVNTDLFSLRYFMHCMACNFCHDKCCSDGVDVDLENRRRLLAMGPEFERFIGVPKEQWFTQTEIADPEFPSGAHVRTQVVDGACVFLNRSARGCKVHTWCLENAVDYHELKPLVSVLFPATFDFGVLGPSNEVADGSLTCYGEGPTAYEGARDEIAYYFGPELVAELDALKSDTLGT